MDEHQRVEVATKLIIGYVAEKGTVLVPYSKMKRKLNKYAKDMGVKDFVFQNFVRAFFDYLTVRSFSDDDVTAKKKFDIAVDLGHIEDVAIKTIKQLIKVNGFRLKDDKRRLGQISQSTGLSKEDIVAVFNPIMHQVVDEIIC